jgi:hypothetical protein
VGMQFNDCFSVNLSRAETLVFQNDIQQFSGNLSEMKESKKQKNRDEQIRF